MVNTKIKLITVFVTEDGEPVYSQKKQDKGFDIVNKAEVDVFLELSCFLDDPTDVGNFIFGSSAFAKSNLNIWKFTVHVLLKPGCRILSITLLACEMCAIVYRNPEKLEQCDISGER